jgi:DNA ligase-1
MQRRDLLSILPFGLLGYGLGQSSALQAATEPKPLWLANSYAFKRNVTDYWVSEKYDGVRGHWNGQQLLTRTNHPLNPPDWFTKDWPSAPIEGELWVGRGQFEAAASILQQKQASDEAWKKLHFMVFDMPSHAGTFTERQIAYREAIQAINRPWVEAVDQRRIKTNQDLKELLKRKVELGAEGLMLHLAASKYQAGRSNDQLKLKPQDDAEAKVTGYVAGLGKYANRVGALWVETHAGSRFKIGTGLSDHNRQNPPAIGELITYTYRGLTSTGLPRFASFLRSQPSIAR